MAEYTPVYVSNALDLKCARETGEVVIVSNDEKFFVELDKKVSKSNLGKKTKKLGKGLIGVGVLGLATISAGLIPLAIGAVGSIAGTALSDFKEYDVIVDYSERRVIFLKKKGKAVFNENTDIIKGINLNTVIQKNTN